MWQECSVWFMNYFFKTSIFRRCVYFLSRKEKGKKVQKSGNNLSRCILLPRVEAKVQFYKSFSINIFLYLFCYILHVKRVLFAPCLAWQCIYKDPLPFYRLDTYNFWCCLTLQRLYGCVCVKGASLFMENWSWIFKRVRS